MGFAGTTMGEIRTRSKASHGSIYHHFKSKDQLAAAIYLEGIIDYQAGMLKALEQRPDAREGIYAVVRFHLEWVREHSEWARYLTQMRRAGFMADTEESIEAENNAFAEGLANYFRKHITEGTLQALPREVFISILLGPCQEFVRLWFEKPGGTDMDAAIDPIGEAAWQALRTRDAE